MVVSSLLWRLWHVLSKHMFLCNKNTKRNIKPVVPTQHLTFHSRGASFQYHLWQLQEAWNHGNAMEVQGVLRLRPVHPVLHEQQAWPEPRFRALRDSTLPAVSTTLLALQHSWSLFNSNDGVFATLLFSNCVGLIMASSNLNLNLEFIHSCRPGWSLLNNIMRPLLLVIVMLYLSVIVIVIVWALAAAVVSLQCYVLRC